MKMTVENFARAFENKVENLECEATFDAFDDLRNSGEFVYECESTDEEEALDNELDDWFYDNEDRLNDIYNEAAAYEAETPSLSEYWFGNY